MRLDITDFSKNSLVDFYIESDLYYQKYIEMINSAKVCIHLQTYIFEMDHFGQKVFKALIQASKRKVKIFLLVDGFGSKNFKKNDIIQLKNAGVHFAKFNQISINWLSQWGRRLHHKVLIVDNEQAFVGGINVLSTYLSGLTKAPNLDFAVYVKGLSVKRLTLYCQETFRKTEKYKFPFKKIIRIKNFSSFLSTPIMISINDWVYLRRQIAQRYKILVEQSKEEIIIINSYFFPNREFLNLLILAKKRGVAVKLILPMYSDWPSYVFATQYLYGMLLKNGIEIYQWKNSILHGKLILADQTWSSIGSFNLNYTSFQHNLEINVDVFSKKFSQGLQKYIHQIIKHDCEKIEKMTFSRNTTFSQKMKRLFYYVIIKTITNFSEGMIFQEDKDMPRSFKLLILTLPYICIIFGLIGIFFPKFPNIVFFILGLTIVFQRMTLSSPKI
jgi:cardiolipin synthase